MSSSTQPTGPVSGAIVTTTADSGEAVLVLLDQRVDMDELGRPIPESSVWRGWLASPYTAYASYWDIILRSTLMIHAWNFTVVDAGQSLKVEEVLSDENLNKVRAVFQDYLLDIPVALPRTEEYKYGQICNRKTRTNALDVATGPPVICLELDRRAEFWTHYDGLAKKLRVAAGAALQIPGEVTASTFDLQPNPKLAPGVQQTVVDLFLDFLDSPDPVLMAAAVQETGDQAKRLAILRRADDGEDYSLFEESGKVVLRGGSLGFSALRVGDTRFRLVWEAGPQDHQRLCKDLAARYVRLAAESGPSVNIALEA